MSRSGTWADTDVASGPVDVVGGRVLVGAQVVDVSRLSAHPVPMISQGLVTVAGQGPTDSNGAGKSSFIAGLSLLHADEQWKLASGAPQAAELLFTAELAAQEERFSNADRGYIIGVFAGPAASTVAELETSALTVWLRINRKAPHLQLRWRDGLYVPFGSSEAERASGADALWEAIPPSNGRTDFHANRLSTVLYGNTVRCVSFLSTSVRTSAAANLLAQPLNELTPARIFHAIATLTGIDRELVDEQALRSAEYTHHSRVREAESDLARWEREMKIVEDGITNRANARQMLGTARMAWRTRCARHLADGADRDARIDSELARLGRETKELDQRLEAAKKELAALADDEEIGRSVREAERQWKELDARDRDLDTQIQVQAGRLEDLAKQRRVLLEQARVADGRSAQDALAEFEQAQRDLEHEVSAQAVAADLERKARDRLAAAEAGKDLAVAQLRCLSDAGISAAALLDTVELDADQRAAWEPRLMIYRDAVVVDADDATDARRELAGLPGSVLILADPPRQAGSGELPDSEGPMFGLSEFLSVLAERPGSADGFVDEAARVIVIGGLAEPLTGRATRIATARNEHQTAAQAAAAAAKTVRSARAALQLAETRKQAAEAAEAADRIGETITKLRSENEQRQTQRETLASELTAARAVYVEKLGVAAGREAQVGNLRSAQSRIDADLDKTRNQIATFTAERDLLDLRAREAAWGDSTEAARQFLLMLHEDQRSRTIGQWNEEACHQLNEAVMRCFPEGAPHEEMTAEIRELLIEQRWRRGGLETRVGLVPSLLRALHTHLNQTEQQDTYEQGKINAQRAERTDYLGQARDGLAEAERTTRAHRASLAQGIKSTLKQVAKEFDRLDQAYGGYGADLEYPEPDPPAEPDKPWQWTVTPKWRRAEGKRMSGYNLRGNTAQMDEKAVKLVCAAALAGGGERPLLVILDELGRNLGTQHRREAVALFERIGRDRNITVVGALQDDMERYAIEASGLYIRLRRSSDTLAFNEAPVIVGDEANHARVEMLRNWLASYRPELGSAGFDGDESAA